MNEVIVKLRDAGYEVEEVNFPQNEIDHILNSFLKNAVISQLGRISSIEGEKFIPEFLITNLLAQTPYFVRKIVSFLLKFTGNRRMADIINATICESHGQYWEHEDTKNKFVKEFYNRFVEKKFDALIIPGGPFPAMKHGFAQKLALGWCYFFLTNMTNWPSGAIPVTTVRKDEQYVDENEFGEDMFTKDMKENAEDSEGLPVGVQICGMAYNDEKTLAAMKIVEDLLEENKGFKIPLEKPIRDKKKYKIDLVHSYEKNITYKVV